MPSWRTGNRNLPPKEQGGPPPKFFHPMMMALFAPDPPLEFLPPPRKEKRPNHDIGLAKYVKCFENTAETPVRVKDETPRERRERVRREKREKMELEIKKKCEAYEEEKVKIKGDTFKTLFVGRLSYDVDERKLRREFDRFGPIHSITMIKDRAGNPRGYAFIQYESEKDMREAYKKMNGTKISGYRVVVDVERGRSVRDWKPRRLGGGLGDTRKERPKSENRRVNRYEERRPYDDRRDRGRFEQRSRGYDDRGHSGNRSRGRERDRVRRSRSRSRERRYNNRDSRHERGGYRR